MTNRHSLAAGVIVALAAFGLPLTAAEANHVKIEVTPEHTQAAPSVVVPATPPAPPSTVVTPGAPATVVVPGPRTSTTYAPATVPQTLQAEEIKAHQVRAQTIYANKIEADEIQGVVHQTKSVKMGDTKGQIKAPEVAASVIYADEIKANSVVADNIYVRDLQRR